MNFDGDLIPLQENQKKVILPNEINEATQLTLLRLALIPVFSVLFSKISGCFV